MKPFLELAGITIRAGDQRLFRRSDWLFLDNQNWALAGRNGSGKTLLARAIAGEIPVVEGEIRYGFTSPPGAVSEEGVILVSFEQQKALAGDAPEAVRWFSMEQDDAATVTDFLSYDQVEEVNPYEIDAHRAQTRAEFQRRRRSVLPLLQIEPLLKHSIPSLSNGEMRKVLLARALLRRPRLLILDDVFSGLDAKFRIHLKEILEGLMAMGEVRILLIDALLQDLPRGITHILYVDNCRIVAQGPRNQMMRHPDITKLLTSSPLPARKSRRRPAPSRTAGELIRLVDVTVEYDGQAILSNVHWTVLRGESWALTGPNGSGKSTLLSLISGDNPQAYANDVSVFGRRRGTGESVWSIKKKIGSISPEMHLHFPDAQTALETVVSGFRDSIGLYSRPASGQREAARRILSRFALERFAAAPFGSLSAGSQRMVLLARALVKSPDLLLLDEPCHGLDAAHRALFLRAVETLILSGSTTVIYVTHRREEIPGGITKVLRLHRGRAQSAKISNRRAKGI